MKKGNLFANPVFFVLAILTLVWLPTNSSRAELISDLVCANGQQTRGYTLEEIGQEQYLSELQKAKETVSELPENMSIKFPLGVNCPIRLGNPENSASSSSQVVRLEAIGFVDSSKQPHPITSADIIEIFDRQIERLNNRRPEAQTPNTLTTARQTSPQTDNVSVIDLIAIEPQTKQVYILPNIRFAAVIRDVFNAVVNKELKGNKYEVRNLDLRTITEPDIEVEREI